jgi:hypothetical protein
MGSGHLCAGIMRCYTYCVLLLLGACREFTLNMISEWFVEVSCSATGPMHATDHCNTLHAVLCSACLQMHAPAAAAIMASCGFCAAVLL